MNFMDVIQPIAVALIAAIPGVMAYRTATNANRATAAARRMEIESGAYERAREMYESALDQLQKQLSSIQGQLNNEREISNNLRNQVNALEDTVARLRRQLIIAGVTDAAEGAGVLKVRFPRQQGSPAEDPPASSGEVPV